jgi:hypothetical protein
MDKSYNTQSIVFWFRDFMGTRKQNCHALSLHGGDDFFPDAMNRRTQALWPAEIGVVRVGKRRP